MAYEFRRQPRHVLQVHTKHRVIETDIPCRGTQEILERLDKVESRSMHGQLPIVWQFAHGHCVLDPDHNQFLDFTSGIFAASMGHGDNWLSWVGEHVEFMHSYTYATNIRADYLERLMSWSGFEKAFLLSSGTEATEAALKLMRLYGKHVGKEKPGVVCLQGAFHGRTMGARMMSSNTPAHDAEYRDPWIHRITLPPPTEPNKLVYFFQQSLGQLWQQDADPERDICGFMIESFRGWNAGFHDPDFIRAIALFCKQRNTLLCFDEMQAGFGRTGKKFGFEHYGVKPDLICVGKGMGGGFPVSGVLGRADVLDLPEPGDMSSTHSGNPLACAVGLAVIEKIEHDGLVSECARKGGILAAEFVKMKERFKAIDYISGEGLIWAVVFKQPGGEDIASRVVERCMEKGLLVVHTGRESIKIGPPLIIPDDALIEGVGVLSDAIAEIAGV